MLSILLQKARQQLTNVGVDADGLTGDLGGTACLGQVGTNVCGLWISTRIFPKRIFDDEIVKITLHILHTDYQAA